MFGVPSTVPCLVFPPLCHVWCSLHCAMFGVPSIVPCLVFPPLCHVWCSLHCAMFGVPSIVPCLVFPPLCHVWCSLHCAMFGVPTTVSQPHTIRRGASQRFNFGNMASSHKCWVTGGGGDHPAKACTSATPGAT